jgi:toxin CcdB
MAQFDVFRNPRGRAFPLLLDVQAELLSDLATRVVVPMAPKRTWAAARLSRLNPTATVERREYVIVLQELAAIPRSALGEPVASLAARRVELIAALDVLFTGV